MMYGRAGACLHLVAVEHFLAVLGPVAVGVQQPPESDEFPGFGRERRVGHPLPDQAPRCLVLTAAVSRRGRQDQPLAAVRHRHEVVVAPHFLLTARIHLTEAIVDDELVPFLVVDGERSEVRRVAAQRGLRFFAGGRIAGETRPHLRLDVHAHVAGLGVDDVAVRVEVGGSHPLPGLRIAVLGLDQFEGADELRAIGGRTRA